MRIPLTTSPPKIIRTRTPVNLYVKQLTARVRTVRNLIYHFVGLETENARDVKHQVLVELEHQLELQY